MGKEPHIKEEKPMNTFTIIAFNVTDGERGENRQQDKMVTMITNFST